MKKYLKSLLYILSSIIIFTLITTVFFYFNIINTKILSIIELIIPIISILLPSYLLGKKSIKNGYIEGLKLSLLFIAIIFILNLLFFKTFNINNLIFYTILIVTSMLGSMIGINNKKDNN